MKFVIFKKQAVELMNRWGQRRECWCMSTFFHQMSAGSRGLIDKGYLRDEGGTIIQGDRYGSACDGLFIREEIKIKPETYFLTF
jgi:hypothetical protein